MTARPSPRLSPGAPMAASEGPLRRQFTREGSSKEKCEQAVIFAHIWATPNREFGTLPSGPTVSLESSCHLSCPAPGATATHHRAPRGSLSRAQPTDARGFDGSVSIARAGGLGGGFAYEMEPRIPKGPERPPERQRAAERPVLQGPRKGTGGSPRQSRHRGPRAARSPRNPGWQ